ncbi:unnamed protein product [Protopolystoma xenopodis]|uniref:Uncharacterized protein n=1 Tax=Protopolystoma xenopodis TaxID=117903 RepID=A0A448XQP4_9PLAT|nr:unnamed protein product [Protopolystoma xenopodis]
MASNQFRCSLKELLTNGNWESLPVSQISRVRSLYSRNAGLPVGLEIYTKGDQKQPVWVLRPVVPLYPANLSKQLAEEKGSHVSYLCSDKRIHLGYGEKGKEGEGMGWLYKVRRKGRLRETQRKKPLHSSLCRHPVPGRRWHGPHGMEAEHIPDTPSNWRAVAVANVVTVWIRCLQVAMAQYARAEENHPSPFLQGIVTKQEESARRIRDSCRHKVNLPPYSLETRLRTQ